MINSKITSCFVEALGISEGQVTESLKYNSIPQWDSVGHMTLIAGLEEQFDVMFDTDDILDMSTPLRAQEILAKYDVAL